MEHKNIEKFSNKKTICDICMIVLGLIFILFGIVYIILDQFVSSKISMIFLICWLAYSLCFFIAWLVIKATMKKQQRVIKVNNYNFDRTEKPEQIITTFESLNNGEKVIFNRKKLRYLGLEYSYDELIFDYFLYDNSIMLHVFLKEEQDLPLLIFEVNREFYHCAKFLKLHIEDLDKEIDSYNLNFN